MTVLDYSATTPVILLTYLHVLDYKVDAATPLQDGDYTISCQLQNNQSNVAEGEFKKIGVPQGILIPSTLHT